MLKIGVVGLRPRQISDLMTRTFASRVECLELFNKKRSEPALLRFGQDCDRIVMVEKAIPPWAVKMVPAEKRFMVGGGISSVAHCIENLEALAADKKSSRPVVNLPTVSERQAHQAALAAAEAALEASRVALAEPSAESLEKAVQGLVEGGTPKTLSQALAEAPKITKLSLAQDVPPGKHSQYCLPKSDILINYPNSGGVQDYKILIAAQPGDVVRFARPEGLNLERWRMRVSTMRSYYWRQKSILLEAHFFEEYVDILVMNQAEDTVPKNTIAVRIEKPSEDSKATVEPRPTGSTTLVTDAEGISATPTTSGILTMNTSAAEAVEAAAGAMAVETPEVVVEESQAVPAVEPAFWCDVYLVAMRQGKEAPESHADAALALYRQRFA